MTVMESNGLSVREISNLTGRSISSILQALWGSRFDGARKIGRRWRVPRESVKRFYKLGEGRKGRRVSKPSEAPTA